MTMRGQGIEREMAGTTFIVDGTRVGCWYLHSLHKDGVLSDDEFLLQKSSVLKSLSSLVWSLNTP